MADQQDFFHWQARVLGGLLGWGVTNVVVGAPFARADDQVVRQVARQAVAWGIIDLVIAWNGRRGARRQARAESVGAAEAAADRFQLIVALNVVLDIGYMLGGAWLVSTAGTRHARRGAGLGIMLQGAFLGCYDSWLLQGVARWLRPSLAPDEI